MVFALPSKHPDKNLTASAPITSTATFTEEPLSKSLHAESHMRHHVRAHTGGTVPFTHDHSEDSKMQNRVLMVLMRRLGSSKTFGENVIFMLNRSGQLDPCRGPS